MRLAHTRRNFSLLVGVALFITIIWRVEVELRGWEGLILMFVCVRIFLLPYLKKKLCWRR
jgi:hypothetical protein